MYFSTKGSWSVAQTDLTDRAAKALFALKRSPAFAQLNPHFKLYIYDKKILPILLYGSEIWGSNCINAIESSHYSFCKYVLGIPRRAENLSSAGELGRVNLSCFSVHRKVKYWLDVLSQSDDKYTSVCYRQLFNLTDSNAPSWANDVKLILCMYGFGDIWIHQGVYGNETDFLNFFLQRLIDTSNQNWVGDVSNMRRLLLYKQFKKANYFESYLCKFDSRYHQVLFTRLRCGFLNLEVNTGRMNDVPRNNRLCTFCNKGQIEDEFHFLLVCPIYSEFRSLYIPKFFFRYPSVNRFCLLLNTDSPTLLRNITLFVDKAMKTRRDILSYCDYS